MELIKHGFVDCGKGCGYCDSLEYEGEDDYTCKETGDLLDVTNAPCVYQGVYCLFNYVPCPSANCPKGKNR